MRYLLLFLLLLSCPSFAQNATYAEVVQRFAASRHFQGVVLVATGGRIEHLQSVSPSDPARGPSLRADTRFPIASITKTFTAILILQLAEEGRLRLDAPLAEYLPAYRRPGTNAITLRHLLTYSSGIPATAAMESMEPYRLPLSPDSFLARYGSGAPEFTPGTKSVYSNVDYILLGRVAEAVTGKPYAELVAERILRPVGMHHTGMLHPATLPPGLAWGYSYTDSTKTFSADAPYAAENYFSAGALYSTAEDLYKLDRALFAGWLLKATSVAEMIRPNAALGNAGLGFWHSSGWGAIGEPYVYRPGGIGGNTANWIHLIDSDRCFIVLSNTNATNLFELSQELYKASGK
ncbi:serine hydrolase domain-containing protein [Flaviaesturariibacter amylovorans]|uniref:Serine hydrolase domain-containing protein n=1 Tax=Flaviaesturariibacter amylovorans TaxID=1084520 RepID=A0ABP8HTE2_9BACT